ncbi:MAG: hypothetical protein KDB63_04945 [Nocardioidaceae bacterium]|nr:hypothetical protein [Nocardioidaceae bacterium]
MRAAAEQQLDALAGGASLCSIARSGAAFPGGKYQEGRAYVAGVVARELRQGRSPHEAIDAARARWATAAPESRRGATSWQAYGEGGDDALAELTELAERT